MTEKLTYFSTFVVLTMGSTLRCRAMRIRDVAKEVHLDWHTVKGLEKQYMEE